MSVYACISMNDYPGCEFVTFLQQGAVRRAFADHVEIDWPLMPGDRWYYGVCMLCLTDWKPPPRECDRPNPPTDGRCVEIQQCAVSPPLLLGELNGVPLPEPPGVTGLLAAAALLALLSARVRHRRGCPGAGRE